MATSPRAGPSPVNIVFVGAGAVGCFYASRLHHPAHNIHASLIARSNYKAIAANGVRMRTRSFGDYTFVPAAVFPSVGAAASRVWDYVVVTTKALPDLTDDSELVAPLVGPKSCIVLIQNGIGVEEQYRKRFPTTPIVSAVTIISAEQISLGTIKQNRWTRIHLGPYSDSASFPDAASSSFTSSLYGTKPGDADESTGLTTAAGSTRPNNLERRGAACVAQLTDWWTHLGGIRDVEATDEIGLQTIRWHKLCINAAMNPSAVLSGGRGNADMVSDPELRHHLAAVMREIWDAAPKILGRPFPSDLATPEVILASTERNVGSRPSMLLDWEAGRPLEIEVILGNPVRIARARGVELPRLQTVYALLRSMQAQREARAGGKEVQGKGKL